MSIPYSEWCIEKGWNFIHPEFRGKNNRPEATCSELVVRDILGAVEFARENASIDPDRIYLIGCSGGGMAALMMASRAPELWAGVSAWVPILDLRDWYRECEERGLAYAGDMVSSCGGAPGASAAVDREYELRSPITYLRNAGRVKLDINAGLLDGHAGSVPISHSLEAFNILADKADRLSAEEIDFMTKRAEVPPGLRSPEGDSSYGREILFRRSSANSRVTIFDGGHEVLPNAGLAWLEKQSRNRAVNETQLATE
jgi:pimeloyl-ACP methyl ester carboxylesterase